MKTVLSQTNSKASTQTVQLHKALLPIDTYMTREGVSESVVEEYRRLGIVQIRKHKGRKYVIEIPLEPYPSEPQAEQPPARAKEVVVQAEQASSSIESIVSSSDTPTAEDDKLAEKTAITAVISQLFVRFLLSVLKIACTSRPIFRTAGNLCIEPFVMAGNLARAAKSRVGAMVRIRRQARPRGKSAGRLATGIASTGFAGVWKVGAGFSLILLCASLVTNGWLFIERQSRIDRLDNAYAAITIKHNNYIKAKLRNDSLGAGLDDFSAEINLLRNELSKSAEEVQNLRVELMGARGDIQQVKQHNTEVQAKLNEKIRNLTARPKRLTSRLRTPPNMHN